MTGSSEIRVQEYGTLLTDHLRSTKNGVVLSPLGVDGRVTVSRSCMLSCFILTIALLSAPLCCVELPLLLPPSAMDPNSNKEVLREFPRLFRQYKDGTVERFMGTDTTPPGTDPLTNAQSKDVTINPQTGVAARLYLPPNPAGKLPLLIYIHGGAFCICSPFNTTYHRHLNTLTAETNAVVVSVHYRLAPEHPLPTAYDDTWEAIQWTAKHAAVHGGGPEPWLNDHADFSRVFLAGDSAGANLAHNMAMRGAVEGFGGFTLDGVVLIHPYFGNDQRDELTEFLYPSYGGLTDPKIHPEKDPNLSGLGCRRVLVLVAEKDFLRERGRSYYETVKGSAWSGTVEMVETEGEGHVFHLMNPSAEKSVDLVKQIVSFIKQSQC